jgi:hyperosmotically inducible periplasmic protein
VATLSAHSGTSADARRSDRHGDGHDVRVARMLLTFGLVGEDEEAAMKSRTMITQAGTALLAVTAACGGSSPAMPGRSPSSMTQTTSAPADDVGSTSPTAAVATTASGQGDGAMGAEPRLEDFERRTTAEIQRRLLGDPRLSVTAKNVEVVTVGRTVRLRGDVKTEEEKARIEGHVRSTLGVTDVDDGLRIVK